MKMILILGVLLAALLLVTGIAFASCLDRVCYSVYGTNLTNPADSFTAHIWEICFGNTPAVLDGVTPPYPPLSNPTFIAVFTDGVNGQAVGTSPTGATGNAIYMTFHGDNFNGIFSPDATVEYRIHGYGVECP